ncbi:polysaccharide deacetylase family protein [Oricola cellulosilytica]|uniref:Chitooligosaccharide deacetylase n=1 Tax=Oricola cellulosilytica TaxID=1429082 RepID=A0A4R0PFL5_9HYPH|nr:polysaccharide deacetylase family protein [Oricola cellulosilytica]TCD15389.1 polysaccharide deacetylase [Oricola cellulosilytica]
MHPLVKQTVISAGLEAIAQTRAGEFLPGAAGRGIVFTLHHVRPASTRAFEPNRLLSVTPDFLDSAIRETLDQGYIPVALEDLQNAVSNARENEKFVAFTLDDGCRDNARHAAPVFRKHAVPFTLFITKGLVERTHTMWWETAEALTRSRDDFRFDFGQGIETVDCRSNAQKHRAFIRLARFIETVDEDFAVSRLNAVANSSGVDPIQIVEDEILDAESLRGLGSDPLAGFGVHTISHCNLARVNDQRLQREIVEPIAALKDWTGKEPKSIAYPYGWKRACGEREASAAHHAGLSAGVTTRPGVIHGSCDDNWMLLPRVSLNGLYQKKRYVRALLSGIPFRFM